LVEEAEGYASRLQKIIILLKEIKCPS